jgi:hypothetical protein
MYCNAISTPRWSQDTVFSWLSKTGFNYETLGLVWSLWMRQGANQIVEFGLNIVL